MAQEPSRSWKDRYLDLLDTHEALDKQADTQAGLFRRSVINLSAIAGGFDEQLDTGISALKEALKDKSVHAIEKSLAALEQAIEHYESHRSAAHSRVVEHYRDICDNLKKLKITADLKKEITQSAQRASDFDSTQHYAQALEHLARFQRVAFGLATKPDEGLWQKLKGGKILDVEQEAQPCAPDDEPEAKLALTEAVPVAQNVSSAVQEHPNQEMLVALGETLKEFLNALSLSDDVQPKIHGIDNELSKGLTWERVIPIIEKIRDVLMRCYMDMDTEFGQYLVRVNTQLHTIYETLNNAVGLNLSNQAAADVCQATISEQMTQMRASLESTDNINDLKRGVNQHIAKISEALAHFKENYEKNDSVTQQLQQLIAKVQSIEHESLETKEMLEAERYKATHDPLTGLANRSAYIQKVEEEYARFKRYKNPLTIVMCDIDHFKKFNDTYGHQIGDKVLKIVGATFDKRFRDVDFVARYGGEEFVIIMPETQVEDAEKVLNSIREAIAAMSLRFGAEPVMITISFGLTQFQQADTVESAFNRADQALYKAKNEGRNKCCTL